MRHLFRTGMAVLALSAAVAAQQGGGGQADRDVGNRLNALSKQLDPENSRGVSERQWDDSVERNTKAFRAEVTRFVETQVRPADPASAIEGRLRSVMADQERASEHSDPPTAHLAPLRYGRSLILTYTVPRPPHFDSAQIYAFRDDGGKFRLTGIAGDDFDGYSLFTRRVASPDPAVFYVLAGGQLQTFNGSKMRFRLYAFDGASFTTLWQPEDVFNATVRVTPRGFTITSADRPQADGVTAEYETTLNGVVKIR